MNCIESIYDACVNGCFPGEAEFSKFDCKSSDIAGKIETVLKEEDVSHNKTEELFDLISDMSVHKETRGFCYGFRLGSQLMAEILWGKCTEKI